MKEMTEVYSERYKKPQGTDENEGRELEGGNEKECKLWGEDIPKCSPPYLVGAGKKMTAHACRNKGRAGGEVIGSFFLAVRKRMSQGAV